MPIFLTNTTSEACGAGRLAGGSPAVANYGETGIDIGDIAVTKGATYFVCYVSPNYPNLDWVTYWWAGGNTATTSDVMQVKVQGYNR